MSGKGGWWIGWQTDDGIKGCGCEKQETRGRVVSARTPTHAPSIVSWSTRARSLFSSLRTRWRTSGFSHSAPSPPPRRLANGRLPCLPERVAVHDLLGRGSPQQGGSRVEQQLRLTTVGLLLSLHEPPPVVSSRCSLSGLLQCCNILLQYCNI